MRRIIDWRGGKVFLFLVAAMILFIVLGGCERGKSPTGTGDAPGVSASSPSTVGGEGEVVEVHIRNFRFHPAELRVKPGTRVVFINEDVVEHNVLQSSGHRIGAGRASFESPILAVGQRWSKVFTEPGEYPIVCTVDGHQLMGMVGTIVVAAD